MGLFSHWIVNIRRITIALVGFFWISNSNATPASLGNLQVSPPEIRVSHPTQVTFYVQIDDPDYIQGSAVLLKVDSEETALANLGRFRDDGQAGDLIAGDKVFSLRVPITEEAMVTSFFKASAAFKGTLLRVFSLSAKIEVRTDAPVDVPLAVVFPNSLIFLNPTGIAVLSIPLIGQLTDNPNTSVRVITGDFPHVSDNGRCAALLTNQAEMVLVPGQEDDGAETTSSKLQYFCEGIKLWERVAPSGLKFLSDLDNVLLSRDGSRIVLVTQTDQDDDPIIEVLGADGSVKFSEQGDIRDIASVEISSSGRFLYVRGLDQSLDLVAKFYDLDLNREWTYELPLEIYHSLSVMQNALGSFTVIGDDMTLFEIPVR